MNAFATVRWTTCSFMVLLLNIVAMPVTEAANFSARGNEPGWHVEVGDGGVMFRTQNGETLTVSPAPEPRTVDGARIYETTAQGQAFALTVEDKICVDTMSGMPHPQTAAVVWGARRFSGCGGDPAELLRGEWRIEQIDGKAVLAGTQPTLTLDAQNRVSGNASCNRLVGSYQLTGESLSILQPALTRMLCDQQVTEQEVAFVRALESVGRFDIDAGGRLILIGNGQPKIVARRDTSP
jgi:heat shock protein HslJ